MPTVFTTQQIADVIGKTPKWVNTLTNDGILPRISHGKYDLEATIQRYIEYVRGGADANGVNYDEEQALHERAKRKLAEIKLAEAEREVIRVGEVEQFLSKAIGQFRARCITLPSKIAPRVQFENEVPVITSIIREEVNQALQELSDLYAELAAQFGGDDDESVEEAE